MFETNPEHEKIVRSLMDALEDLPMGGTIEYRRLNQIAGFNVQNGKRYLLDRARDASERELGCIFEAVRTIGIKRLTAAEAPEIGLSAIRSVRRKARHQSRRLERINSNSLSDHERKRIIGYRSMLGAVVLLADGNKARTVAAVVDPAGSVPPADILKMFV